jgi:hypothetical protein
MDPRYLEFAERIPAMEGGARLELEAPGSAPRGFVFRADFRETTRGAYRGGSAKGGLRLAKAPADPIEAGEILLIGAEDYEEEDDAAYVAKGAVGLLIETSAKAVRTRSAYSGQGPGALPQPKTGLVKLAVSPGAFKELSRAATEGAIVSMESPLSYEDVEARDIYALWNGDGGDFRPGALLMAHYDHIGLDADGSYFPGALDNASGTGLLLGLADAVKLAGLKADIAFLATDAEEENLSGATRFAADPPFPLAGIRVVNIDMVASKADMALSIDSSGDEASLALARSLKPFLEGAGFRIKMDPKVENADQAPFAARGCAAVTVCEYDESRYHTKSDTADFLSAAEMDSLGEALFAFISNGLPGKVKTASAPSRALLISLAVIITLAGMLSIAYPVLRALRRAKKDAPLP